MYVDLWFKLWSFDLTIILALNIEGLQHCVAKIKELENQSLFVTHFLLNRNWVFIKNLNFPLKLKYFDLFEFIVWNASSLYVPHWVSNINGLYKIKACDKALSVIYLCI